MEQDVATVLWKKFYVHLAGKTNNAHQGAVVNLKRIGHTEVDSPESSDYILVFCPIVSKVGTDIGAALESAEKNNPGGKPIILVVMHHTFDPDRVIAESRRLVKNQNVKLTVDCLIYEGELLKCDRNDTAWSEVQKIFGVSEVNKPSWLKFPATSQSNDQPAPAMVPTVQREKFYVHLAGKTNNAHRDFVVNLKRIGHTEVDSPESSDYILIFCPIVSRVGTDIGEALESTEKNNPGGKPIILVVMHRTFDPDRDIAESRRLVKNQNVKLTVDCLIYQGKLLKCDRNDTAWSEVRKIFEKSPRKKSSSMTSQSNDQPAPAMVPTVPRKKFYVHLAGKTNNAHRDFVKKFKRIGHTEVDSPESSDYILVFCPIVSKVGTDIGEALESTEKNNPGGKPIILVVMHHTFDPDRVIAESRRLVKNQNVKLTVDCLIYEGELLKCDRNDTAWSEVRKIFGVSEVNTVFNSLTSFAVEVNSLWKKFTATSQSNDQPAPAMVPTVQRKKLYVHLAGKTNNANRDFVEKFKRIGHTEVDSPESSDYILVFCPIVSQVRTDIGEALESAPGGKPIILVVMHHTFDPDRVIAESRRLVKNQNVKLTVDCLIYEGELLKCDRNDTAWSEVQNIFA